VLGLLDRPTAGATAEGEDVRTPRRRPRRPPPAHAHFVFQFFHLIPRLTALGGVELPPCRPAPRARRGVRGVLESVGLKPRLVTADQLSGRAR
jgi:putative ABC transport system ATP-binding protein